MVTMQKPAAQAVMVTTSIPRSGEDQQSTQRHSQLETNPRTQGVYAETALNSDIKSNNSSTHHSVNMIQPATVTQAEGEGEQLLVKLLWNCCSCNTGILRAIPSPRR